MTVDYSKDVRRYLAGSGNLRLLREIGENKDN